MADVYQEEDEDRKRSFLEARQMQQARSQVCVTWVAKLSWWNHVVQNLRAYSIRHVATIKSLMCVQGNIELSSMSQRPRLSSFIISGDFSLATTIMQ